jgi:hypothetical protein
VRADARSPGVRVVFDDEEPLEELFVLDVEIELAEVRVLDEREVVFDEPVVLNLLLPVGGG